MKRRSALVIGLIFIALGTGVFIPQWVMSFRLNQNCIGYLKQAADASNVETAKTELKKSIDYLEAHEMTTGYTSIFWNTPDEDVSFFYGNLKSSYDELSKVTDSTSQMESSNLLMKLRETIIDHGSEGDNITYPMGLHKFPNNLGWFVLSCVGVVLIGIGMFCLIIAKS